jgi:ring-1,2-phenylacetyl-CoA epoxidase subunit PaaE
MNSHLKLKVTRVKRETADAISLYFDANSQIDSFYPGQFLTLVLPFEGRGGVRRSYSICTTPAQLPEIGVCIKRVDNGLVSNLLNDNAKEGQQYEIIEPYGQFSLNHKIAQLPTLVLIGAGSGITPLMSILKTALAHSSQPNVVLLYGNRDEENVIFSEELTALQQANTPRSLLFHFSNSDMS